MRKGFKYKQMKVKLAKYMEFETNNSLHQLGGPKNSTILLQSFKCHRCRCWLR